jgi:sensor histidine kinase regulating citrate/malate metabolism
MPHNGDTLFKALIATAVDGTVIVDSAGIVQLYNDACGILFGYASDAMIGRDIRFPMPPLDGLAEEREHTLSALRAGATIRNMCDFTEKRDSTKLSIDLNRVAREAIGLGLAGLARPDVEMLLDLDETLSPVLIDRMRDGGPGLPENVQMRLFEPFVTTKENGMGIGLAICQSIVEAHGGTTLALRDETPGAAFPFRVPFVGQREAA